MTGEDLLVRGKSTVSIVSIVYTIHIFVEDVEE